MYCVCDCDYMSYFYVVRFNRSIDQLNKLIAVYDELKQKENAFKKKCKVSARRYTNISSERERDQQLPQSCNLICFIAIIRKRWPK